MQGDLVLHTHKMQITARPSKNRLSTAQAMTATLKAHIVDAPSAVVVSRLLPGIMEGLASLIEEGLPAIVAPFADAAGPVLDARALDRSLNDMWRTISAATPRGGKGGGAGAGPSGSSISPASTAATTVGSKPAAPSGPLELEREGHPHTTSDEWTPS